MALIWALMVMALAQRVCAFNLNTDLVRLLQGPNQTYFGYSVALWVDVAGAARLVVGAPRGTNTTSGNHSLPLGVLHVCEVFGSDCPNHPNLPTLSKRDSSSQTVFWGEGIREQGIGFTEAIFTANSGRSSLVACAPRYSIAVPEPSLQPRGACYVLNDVFVSTVRRIVPFQDQCFVVRGLCKDNNHRFTGFSMAGYSVAFNQNQTQLFMGSPYAFYGQGAVVSRSTIARRRSGVALNKNYFGDKILDFSSEGWAVAVARFDGASEMVAASAPNNEIFDGMVNFYTEDLDPLPQLSLYGSDVGAKFGFSMDSGDVDGDGADDLAVGAPLAPGDIVGGPDAGKVYLYYAPGKEQTTRVPPLVLEGRVSWGRFGQAVTSPGDLNLDGYEDLVVGAPNEGPGAVYVFNGAPDGLLPNPTQRIYASQFSPHLRGFGFSLDGGQDMDDNGYPDLIIGAPESDASVFLRSAPVINLVGSVEFEPPIVVLGEKSCTVTPPGDMAQDVVCFQLVVDLQYTTPNMARPVEMTLELHLDQNDGRLSFLDNHQSRLIVTRNVTSSRGPSQPWRVPAYVKPGRPQWETSLIATVKVSLQPLEDYKVDPEKPQEVPAVLDVISQTTFSGVARLACADVSTCFSRPDLVIAAQAPSELMIGNGTLAVQVEVGVLNDTAHSTKLFVNYPPVLSLGKVSGQVYLPHCSANPASLHSHSHTCAFSSDILKGEKVPLTLHFEYDPQVLLDHLLTSSTNEVHLNFNVSSASVDLDEEDNSVDLTIQTVTQADLYVIGSSFPGVVEGQAKEFVGLEVFSSSPGPIASPLLLGPGVSLDFSLTNQGPSPLLSAKMLLRLPLRLNHEGPPLLYLLEPPRTSRGVTCSPLSLNPNGFKFNSINDEREDVPDGALTTDEGEDVQDGSPVTKAGEDTSGGVPTTTQSGVLTTDEGEDVPDGVLTTDEGKDVQEGSPVTKAGEDTSGGVPTTTQSGVLTTDEGEDVLDIIPVADEGQDVADGVPSTTVDFLADTDFHSRPAEAPSSQGNAPEISQRRRRRQVDPTSSTTEPDLRNSTASTNSTTEPDLLGDPTAPTNSTTEPDLLGDPTAPTNSTTEPGLSNPTAPTNSTTEPDLRSTDATEELMADNFTNGDIVSQTQALTLGCDVVPCEVVTCDVPTLAVGGVATVSVYGYIVISTLKHVGQLMKRQSVRLESLVSVEATGDLGLVTGDLHNQTVTISAKLVKDAIKLPLGITWWHWLAVLLLSFLGILIMMVILQKVGFFKRTLPPSSVELAMASANPMEDSQGVEEGAKEDCKS